MLAARLDDRIGVHHTFMAWNSRARSHPRILVATLSGHIHIHIHKARRTAPWHTCPPISIQSLSQ